MGEDFAQRAPPFLRHSITPVYAAYQPRNPQKQCKTGQPKDDRQEDSNGDSFIRSLIFGICSVGCIPRLHFARSAFHFLRPAPATVYEQPPAPRKAICGRRLLGL